MIEKLKDYLKSHKFELVPWEYKYDPAIKELYVEHGESELRLAMDPKEYGNVSELLKDAGYDAGETESSERNSLQLELPTYIMVRNPHIFK